MELVHSSATLSLNLLSSSKSADAFAPFYNWQQDIAAENTEDFCWAAMDNFVGIFNVQAGAALSVLNSRIFEQKLTVCAPNAC